MKIPYVVAEVGCNGGGDIGLNLDLIHAAKDAGCSCVKFQAYDTDHLIKNSPVNEELSQYQINDWEVIAEHANARKIDWFASCFHQSALKAIAKHKPCRWKSAAPDLLEASKWKTKLEWWASYDPRYYLLNNKYNTELLHNADVAFLCRSDYPAMITDYFSRSMEQCRESGLFQGLSDHTPGLELVGAIGDEFDYFEKHFKLDDDCIDNFALNPAQMKMYVEKIHTIHGDHNMESDRLRSYRKRLE